MNLSLWNPMREFEALSQRMNQMLSRFGSGNFTPTDEWMKLADWSPACDISETDKAYQIKVELPDVKKDDVHVTVENGMLVIQGERKHEAETKNAKFHRIERSFGAFQRRFTLPADVDAANISAAYKDGLLTVELSKTPTAPKAKPTEVKIK